MLYSYYIKTSNIATPQFRVIGVTVQKSGALSMGTNTNTQY